MAVASRVLVVDDDAGMCEALSDALRLKGHDVRTAHSGRDAIGALDAAPADVAIVDIHLSDISGLELLDDIKRASPGIEVIFVTAHASVATAIQAIDGAAFAYITKPFEIDDLMFTVHRAQEKQELVRALRESEERYRLVIEHCHDAIFLMDLEGRYTFGNRRMEDLTGYRLDELVGQSSFKLLTPDGAQAASARREAMSPGHATPVLYETELVRKDGTTILVEVNSTGVIKDGKLIARLGAARDISERKRSEAALRETEELFRATFEQAATGITIAALDGRFLRVNQRLQEILGYSRDELQALRFQDITHPDDLDKNLSLQRRLLANDIPNYSLEKRLLHKRGAYVRVNVAVSLVRAPSGEPRYTIAIVQDITQRKAAEVALRESEERFRAMFEQAAVGMAIVAPDGRWLRVNQRLADMVGYTVEELLALRYQDITHPDDIETSLRRRQTMLDGGTLAYSLDKRYVHRNGSIVWVDLTTSVMRGASGGLSLSVAVIQDITQRKASEAALRESEARFRATFEQAAVGITVVANDGRLLRVNQRFCDMVGYTSDELLTRRFLDITHRDDVDTNVARRRPMMDGQAPSYSIEKRYVHKNGSIVWVDVTASHARDASGEAGYSIGIVQDITERKQLEQELQHAQRMEGVGQLAGGIAHDFNNLLTVISGRAQLGLDRLGPADPLRRDLDLIHKTADRAALLTRQLLAFSRKQVLQPKVLDMNEQVRSSADLLKRIIGENIELTFVSAPDSGRVRVDPGQLEQVVVNLAVNARDAMPDGGRITIETAGVELDADYAARHIDVVPGAYAVLTVTRHRCRHEPRDAGAHLRALLHDQGAGQGDGPRPRDGLRHREAERRAHPRVQRAGHGHVVQDLSAAHRRAGGAGAFAFRRRAPTRDRNRPARRGRGRGAWSRARDPREARLYRARSVGAVGRDAHRPAAPRDHRAAADRRGHAADERTRAGGNDRRRAPRDEGAVHVGLHRRRDRAPRRARARHPLHREAVHAPDARDEDPRGARRTRPKPPASSSSTTNPTFGNT